MFYQENHTAEYPATRGNFCVAGYAVHSEWYLQECNLSK